MGKRFWPNSRSRLVNWSISACQRRRVTTELVLDLQRIIADDDASGAVLVGVADFFPKGGVRGTSQAVEHAVRILLLRFVADDNDRLSLDVDVGVIVVTEVPRGDAVADEHKRKVEGPPPPIAKGVKSAPKDKSWIFAWPVASSSGPTSVNELSGPNSLAIEIVKS